MSQFELWPLAEFTAGYKLPASDTALQQRLRTTFLDWGSAALAGTGHPLYSDYCKGLLRPGETGPCRVIGQRGQNAHSQYPLSQAAMANAAISHLWEVDDAHRDATAHPGITILPVVLSLAEVHNLDAATVCAAVVAGYETILRIGSHLGAGHYKVNHSTATAGTMGAAAAAARALGLDSEKTLWALGHAGTQAAGLWAFLDDNKDAAKAFHAATAVRNGLEAAHLAAAGIPGAPGVLEGPRGMRAAWNLEGCDPAWLVPDGPEMIHAVTVKGWPVCGQMHSALDCALALAARTPELAGSSVPVTVSLPESAVAIAGRTEPISVSEAKFSTQFCIAAALCGLPPSLSGLSEDLVQNPQVRKRMQSVSLQVLPEFTARFPKERPAKVTLHGQAGDVSESRDFRQGDPEAPWSDQAMDQRSADVLNLTACATDLQALIAWANALSTCAPGWRATGLYDGLCVPV